MPAWPLSQSANKSNGSCSVCLATQQLHLRDVHRHGPRHDPCLGSGKPPLDVSNHSVASLTLSPTIVNSLTPSQSDRASDFWSPIDVSLIKHIPKSVRSSCASHLASLLRKVVSNPYSSPNWLALLNWWNAVLRPPKRGGKRYNLSKIIKQRISSFTAGQADSDSANFSVKQPKRSS